LYAGWNSLFSCKCWLRPSQKNVGCRFRHNNKGKAGKYLPTYICSGITTYIRT
jgi:hypothetical protein